jgi:hypothetical protein
MKAYFFGAQRCTSTWLSAPRAVLIMSFIYLTVLQFHNLESNSRHQLPITVPRRNKTQAVRLLYAATLG